MKPKVLPILEQCIEVGVRRGYNRAHKHDSSPDESRILECIESEIMSEIYQYFHIETYIEDHGIK